MFLIMLRNLEEKTVCLRLAGYRAQRHFDNDICTLGPGTVGPLSVLTMAGKNMFAVPDMQQGPQMAVTAENNIPPASAITAVGAPFRYEFLSPQMGGSLASAT